METTINKAMETFPGGNSGVILPRAIEDQQV